MFFVRSEESIPCPCCYGSLSVAGSRARVCIQSTGERIKLIIRRMHCEQCRRIHHELPDILVPYKRYDRSSIEQIVTEPAPAVAADESTLRRIRNWFYEWVAYAVRVLSAIEHRFGMPEGGVSSLLQPSLQSSGRVVRGWMAKTVRAITNSNLWVQTRSACLSNVSFSTIHANPTNWRVLS